MKNCYFLIFLHILLINAFIPSNATHLKSESLNAETVIKIDQNIQGNTDHKKAEYDITTTDTEKNKYFKYIATSQPSTLITTFRIVFDSYSTDISNYKVLCVNVDSSKDDSYIITTLKNLQMKDSACINGFKRHGHYDGIVRLDKDKTVLAIMLQENKSGLKFTGRVNVRITERVLKPDESKAKEDETYTLVPYSITVSSFRDKDDTSKILFYSYSRNLQMFYAGNDPFPDSLFSGNILSVYTNPNMVRQKYHNANIMTLLVSPSGFGSNDLNEDFQFEVKLYKTDFLLDYYVSSNSEGRPKNKPLLINMTECTNPYYVILNYNLEEGKKVLILDQIYGKLKALSVAYNFTQNTWDEMIKNDMNEIAIEEMKYHLPENSLTHIDVYKIECELPLMFNFYYTDEADLISKMNYGDINIFTLPAYESVNVPFFDDVISPEIVIELFNPYNEPIVVIKAQDETMYQSNSLIKLSPMTIPNGITFKERAGLSDTRIILKVGYSNAHWKDTEDDYVQYNEQFKVYSFRFPTDPSMYNYTFAFLKTSGTNKEDNLKYCFNTNIGAALKPSSENCYRVSKDNSYTLKVFNPLIMYKDYDYDEKFQYYVTFRNETEAISFEVKTDLRKYDTTSRSFSGISNKITLSDKKGSSILTQPESYNIHTFVQVQVCDSVNSVTAKITNPITDEVIVKDVSIPANSKNKYILFNNIFLDSEISFTGNDNTNIFLRLSGLPYEYTPVFNENYKVSFDQTTNTINIESPIEGSEFMQYTVIIDKENKITEKGYTLCDFVNYKIDEMGIYQKTVNPDGMGSIQINFKKAGLSAGQKFEAIVYIEQKMFTQMAFLSDVISGTVGDISIDTIHEIKDEYTDKDYVYTTIDGKESDLNYYLTYQPDKVLDVPFGAMRIELDDSATGSFSGVYCAFTDNDTDALGIIEEIEGLIDTGDSYCIGGKSKINSKRYNYVFKYEKKKEDNSPKKLIIKIINGNLENGKFNIYIRKEPGIEIEQTDYSTQKEYGQDENTKMSLMPYIVDLKKIRGEESSPNKVSKILFYSQNSELQMYYLPEDDIIPKRLFFGNIALVLTKPDLAIQKYHSTTLILLSENLEEDAVTDSFRFHTKMFKSEDQIEFFVSENSEGRTLNFPLSIEMNTCEYNNNKLYYILNYNKPEPLRTLHLDMIFGSYSKARIARGIQEETWDDLVSSMTNIDNFKADLPEKTQHIDVIEIQCISPLLINAYYSYDSYKYSNLRQGEIVVKDLLPFDELKFTIDPQEGEELFFYSLSLYNQVEVPYVTVRFSDGTEHNFSGNTMQEGQLMHIPTDATVINKVKTKTRFIFKIGLNIEKGKDWKEDTSVQLNGKLFASGNKYVYKYPVGDNKYNFTKIDFLVNGINTDVQNVKFCYSTNLGVALEASKENCFRTGRYIPYTLTFLNPLLMSKDYDINNDKYYISFRPYNDYEYIKLDITENTYQTKTRNEEGKAQELTLENKSASSILTLPQYHTTQILIQLRSCTISNLPVSYIIYNAYTGRSLKEGKTYYKTDIGYGIIYLTNNTYVETEVKLQAHPDEPNKVKAFLKHTAIGNNQIVFQDEYTDIKFDPTKNSVTIKKPIINEEFTMTIVVDRKGKLAEYTQCHFAFGDRSKIGMYQKTFISVTSNTIVHFIDFPFIGIEVGEEFDLLVYAEQKYNSKMEFLYPVFQGTVGEVSGVEQVNNYIEKDQYVTLDFKTDLNSNYLYYDFPLAPYGLVASVKVLSPSAKVTKMSCVFVSKYATQSTMISAVNNAMVDNNSVCLSLGSSNSNEFNALIKAKIKGEDSRLVMQVLYGLGEEDEENIKNKNDLEEEEPNTINIKIAGTQFGDSTGKHILDEKLAPTPYVIDLEEIRKRKIDSSYVSKILFYSKTTNMTMHYISDNSSLPLTLFEGNIMLVYTNPDLIYQKYNNAKQMILTTSALNEPENVENIIDVKYFDSEAQIQYYYLGSDKNGRVLNNPTAIEMTSCNLPYYYILNYNQVEKGDRKLHIDNIFGEVDTMKIATSLDYDSWNELLDNMIIFNDEQIILPETKYPFDIIEVTCKLPLLLNLYYADPNEVKTEDVEIGDIIILSLAQNTQKTLKFKQGEEGPFVYSFNIFQGYDAKPNIEIFFNGESDMEAKENGLHIKDSWINFENVTIVNRDKSSGINTRIILKMGYVIESVFTKIGDDVYQNIEVEGRTINLYGYKYVTTGKKLNITGVDFEISTTEENVKFCYSTNLGTYINPSLTNCFRVGKNNPYTISTRNPLIMYKNYFRENVNNYYVGFRTAELNQNIKIKPKILTYDTEERNIEGAHNKITITGDSENPTYSTILTAPVNNTEYIFTYISICTKGEGLSYEFYNAYNGSKLGYSDNINSDPGYEYRSIPNIKLDTELKLTGKKGLEVFVKHIGLNDFYQTNIQKIKFSYNKDNKTLTWTPPIENEEFKYDLYIDKINNIKNKGYTLCSIVDTTKLGRFHDKVETPYYEINFTKPDLVEVTDFDVIVIAQQLNNGKMVFLSPVYNSNGESSDDDDTNPDNDGPSNMGLIIIIVILSAVILGGGVAAFFIIRKYKSKGVIVADGKATSMAMLGSTKNEKLVESQAVVDP